MNAGINFCLALHNHQPIGNFENVIERAYGDSYLPFLDVFEGYPELQLSLHTSGALMEWLDEHHPEYVDRLARLVREGRIEIIGGAFYEPILTMIPSRDRVGQIVEYATWLRDRLEARIQGLWVPERVWEQSLTSDIAAAGMQYTILDDFHFKNTGLTDDQLYGYFLTEDQGHLLRVFPGSERLRYLIPFGQPEEVVGYLRGVAEAQPGAVLVFGDDGEKFGTWPETRKHVYDDGWLRRFFDALRQNKEWIRTRTLSQVVDELAPQGKIFLPDCSYREMTEWALPVDRQLEYEQLMREFQHEGRWDRVRPFVKGGFWRNFKVRYPETNDMYTRMMLVSSQLEQAVKAGLDGEDMAEARRRLYRGQCNCGYWHGAFGGTYLPHLRNAVYHELLEAENHLDQALGRRGPWIEASTDDYNLDGRQEVRLTNDRLACFLAPARGGQLYELDVRSIGHNLLATLARRPEAYHRKVRAGQSCERDDCASIHDRVVFKQPGLDGRLQYDRYARSSLIDHFYDPTMTPDILAAGAARELGDFVDGTYDARIRRNPERIQVQLTRLGHVSGVPLRLTKGITADAGSFVLEIAYLLEDVPLDLPVRFSVEFNLAGLPAGVPDRYFYRGDSERLGQLETRLDLDSTSRLALVDEWLGLELRFVADRNTGWWTYPVETVSQSENGFELVHQAVAVHPHWQVFPDPQGRWSVTLRWSLDTARAENRRAGSGPIHRAAAGQTPGGMRRPFGPMNWPTTSRSPDSTNLPLV